jgi:signal transduction histidine kinase
VRHRETFDSLSILRAESARLLARTRHGLVSFDAAGNATFTDELVLRILGGAPRTLREVDASLPGLAGTGGERFLVRGDRVLKATLLPSRGRPGEGGRLHLLLEDRTAEARLLGEMAHRESLASLGEASASRAHEIRNSLTAVGTALDTLGRESRPDPAALRGLGEEVRRLGGALERSLSFASAIPLDRQSVDLGRLLRRVAGAAPPGPAVRVEVAGPAGVFADPDLLGRVVHNLLRNAAEAGAQEVRIAVRREEGEAVVTVANDGPPLPPPVLARLFEPFVTGRPGGTGLGLALCRKIVAAHGGRISGRNVAGGVEFEVRLPWTS